MAQIGIFVGTVYGNAQMVAEEAESVLQAAGHQVELFEEGTLVDWQNYLEQYVLVITSTTGQGDLPDNIAPLYQEIADELGYQPKLRYGVIVLGDSSFTHFCGGGQRFDELLQDQQAVRLGEVLKIDALQDPEPEVAAKSWLENWVQGVK